MFIQALHTTCWVAQYSYYVCGHLGINLINKTTIPLGQYQCMPSVKLIFCRAHSIYVSPIKFSQQSGNISFDNYIVYPHLIYTSVAKYVSFTTLWIFCITRVIWMRIISKNEVNYLISTL